MELPDAGFKGSLAATPLPQVLRRIFLGGLKGTLRLMRRDETRNLFFEKGELRTATSSREGQKIGAFLKRRGWITDKDLAWALETVARQGRVRLGKILVERGLVSRSVLDAEMKRLVEEIVFSTFEWEQGEYRFEPSAGSARSGRRPDVSRRRRSSWRESGASPRAMPSAIAWATGSAFWSWPPTRCRATSTFLWRRRRPTCCPVWTERRISTRC